MKNETYQLFTSRQTDAGLEKNEASFWILIVHTHTHTYTRILIILHLVHFNYFL